MFHRFTIKKVADYLEEKVQLTIIISLNNYNDEAVVN